MSRPCVVIAALLVASVVHAQPPADAPRFVAPDVLATELSRPDVVVLHVGNAEAYAREHLPGARLVTLGMITAPARPPVHNELPAPADLEARLEALGIGDDTRVVVYFAHDEIAQAARVAFTLDYAGLGGRTLILDGGLAAWVRSGRPVTADVPSPAIPRTLTLRPRPSALVDLAWVRDHLDTPGLHVLDARPVASYTGEDDRGGQVERPGHLPGAVNLPYAEFFNADRTLKPTADLERLLAGAGIGAGQSVVTYCNSGVQASVPFLVARLLGVDVKLYDGSHQEWAASGAPVIKNSTPR